MTEFATIGKHEKQNIVEPNQPKLNQTKNFDLFVWFLIEKKNYKRQFWFCYGDTQIKE